MLGEFLEEVREKRPFIHNITNYVTANDVANMLLACGGSPIMSDEAEDVEEITSLCDGLNLNMGTLQKAKVKSMLLAGKKANELQHVVVLDPVGAGSSRFRTETVQTLLKEIRFDVIKGNISEIKTLFKGSGITKGVDANQKELITEENLDSCITMIGQLATQYHTIIVVTGKIDLVSDGETCYIIRNGRSEMGSITGTGCQLSALLAAFVSANPKKKLEAAAAAVGLMGVAGETGWKYMQAGDGNATYRNRIIDAVYNMTKEQLDKGVQYEVR